jgi:hypothetical protein
MKRCREDLHSYNADLPQCPECKKVNAATYKARNKERIAKREKAWNEANKTKVLAKSKAWVKNNPDRHKKNVENWNVNNEQYKKV